MSDTEIDSAIAQAAERRQRFLEKAHSHWSHKLYQIWAWGADAAEADDLAYYLGGR